MADAVTQDLLDFISASPSPYHCVAESVRRLEAAGFVAFDERGEPSELKAGDQGYVTRGASIIAWRAGSKSPAEAGFRIFGAHTDSPNLRIKPRPDVESKGYRQWGVETYGGLLISTWLDRDLGVSGRVFVRGKDGAPEARLFRCDRPVARIPNLAIHLNRGVNTEGLILDAQKHLPPMVGLETAAEFQAWLEKELDGASVLSWDLGLHDLAAPTVGGVDDSFIFAPRLDNQASCHLALSALVDAKTADATQVVVLFDHEEIGSRSFSGAMSSFLRDHLSRLTRDHSADARGGLERAIPNSFLVSMDMAHAVHPNYADKHEPKHGPVLNGGPVVKEHVEQRYATDGETSAIFKEACARVGVPCQDFVIRTDLACGSTIGPLSAAELGMRTVDIGNPMLSMHSIREQAGAHDAAMMLKALAHLIAH